MVCFLQNGFTPLSLAAREGYVEVASLRGADPEARDKVSMPRGREVRVQVRAGYRAEYCIVSLGTIMLVFYILFRVL
jgi:hypothetical protein